jgi:hypothetical protein
LQGGGLKGAEGNRQKGERLEGDRLVGRREGGGEDRRVRPEKRKAGVRMPEGRRLRRDVVYQP